VIEVAPARRPAWVIVAAAALLPAWHVALADDAPAAVSQASAADEGLGPPSEAEKMLFLSPQLKGIHEPVTLAYDYEADEAGKHTADHASLVMSKSAGGACCSTHTDYRSGAAAIARPDLDDPGTNPVLLYFLVDQIQSLAHATHGQMAHFQRRIRQALADEAQIKDVTVRWAGKDVPARAIHIAPFVNDPYRVRFEHEARTEYDFVLSDAVPGSVVRLSSTLPAEKAGDPPQAQRTLSIVDPTPAAPARK
jgi:hypothetical protein